MDCLPCIVRQAVEASRLVTAEEGRILEVLRRVFARLACSDLSLTPPEITREVHALLREELQQADPFLSLKRRSTQRALRWAEGARSAVEGSAYPFASAVAFAIAGNILDFGMRVQWDERIVADSFGKALEMATRFDRQIIDRLKDEIDHAERVLVLGDNAGEAVFDRLLIEQFPRRVKTTYAVKSSPVINDVTAQEAIASGIDAVASILPNGADIPGTVLRKCSPDFLAVFNRADVVLSKGQGNFETLNEEERKIWFLFQVKCPVIARHYRYDQGAWMVLEKGPGGLKESAEGDMNIAARPIAEEA